MPLKIFSSSGSDSDIIVTGLMFCGMQELISFDLPYLPLLIVLAVINPSMSKLEIKPETLRCVSALVPR